MIHSKLLLFVILSLLLCNVFGYGTPAPYDYSPGYVIIRRNDETNHSSLDETIKYGVVHNADEKGYEYSSKNLQANEGMSVAVAEMGKQDEIYNSRHYDHDGNHDTNYDANYGNNYDEYNSDIEYNCRGIVTEYEDCRNNLDGSIKMKLQDCLNKYENHIYLKQNASNQCIALKELIRCSLPIITIRCNVCAINQYELLYRSRISICQFAFSDLYHSKIYSLSN